MNSIARHGNARSGRGRRSAEDGQGTCRLRRRGRGVTSRGAQPGQGGAAEGGVSEIADVLGEHGVGVDDDAGVGGVDVGIQQGHQVLCTRDGKQTFACEHSDAGTWNAQGNDFAKEPAQQERCPSS